MTSIFSDGMQWAKALVVSDQVMVNLKTVLKLTQLIQVIKVPVIRCIDSKNLNVVHVGILLVAAGQGMKHLAFYAGIKN